MYTIAARKGRKVCDKEQGKMPTAGKTEVSQFPCCFRHFHSSPVGVLQRVALSNTFILDSPRHGTAVVCERVLQDIGSHQASVVSIHDTQKSKYRVLRGEWRMYGALKRQSTSQFVLRLFGCVFIFGRRARPVMARLGVPLVDAGKIVDGEIWATKRFDGRHYHALVPMELFELLGALISPPPAPAPFTIRVKAVGLKGNHPDDDSE